MGELVQFSDLQRDSFERAITDFDNRPEVQRQARELALGDLALQTKTNETVRELAERPARYEDQRQQAFDQLKAEIEADLNE